MKTAFGLIINAEPRPVLKEQKKNHVDFIHIIPANGTKPAKIILFYVQISQQVETVMTFLINLTVFGIIILVFHSQNVQTTS